MSPATKAELVDAVIIPDVDDNSSVSISMTVWGLPGYDCFTMLCSASVCMPMPALCPQIEKPEHDVVSTVSVCIPSSCCSLACGSFYLDVY